MKQYLKKPWVIVLAIIVVVFAVIASGMTDLYTSAKVRYKITVNVETPEGLISGSAITEVRNWDSVLLESISPPEVVNPAKVRGEAVVVDLGKRGILFALLKGYKFGENYSDRILYETFGGGTNISGLRELRRLKAGQKATLPPYHYPMLVTFKDLNNPKTVAPIFQAEDVKLEELFGEGVHVRDITIEITDENIVWKVKSYIPWLNDYYNQMFDGQKYNKANSELPFANSIASGNFSTGE